MSDTPVVNLAALEPLFAPWEEPDKHRVRATKRDFPAEIKTYRRSSLNRLVDPLRAFVKEWRELNYPGASDTTRTLLTYWFERPHRVEGKTVRRPSFATTSVSARRWRLLSI